MAEYELWLCKDDGTRLAVLDDWESLDYVMAANDVGTCSLVLPGNWSTGMFAADRKVEVWRKPTGGALAMERAYLISGINQETDANGLKRITLDGVDGNDLLRRRVVAYAEGSTGARRSAAADSLMKDAVRLNLSTGSTDTDRVFSTGHFTIEAKSSAGPAIFKDFSRRDVLGICQELSEATKETTGSSVFFDVMSPEPSKYEFRTYVNQIGLDHTYPSGVNPVLLGMEYGNLAEATLAEDYSAEWNVVYGGALYKVGDATRSGRSIWGRRETYANPGAAQGTTSLQDEAKAALADGKPQITFSGKIMDCPGTVYGIHWRWGDRVSAIYGGQTYNAQVDVVRVTRSAETETVEARLGYEE